MSFTGNRSVPPSAAAKKRSNSSVFKREYVIVLGSAGTVQVIYSPCSWARTLQKSENHKEFASFVCSEDI